MTEIKTQIEFDFKQPSTAVFEFECKGHCTHGVRECKCTCEHACADC